MNHPATYSNILGLDLYLNPHWGIDTLCPVAKVFVYEHLNVVLGEPDLWFHGNMFHELLWGPRDLPRSWRPSFHINLSGTNALMWRNFWLPWRGTAMQICHQTGVPLPSKANTLERQINEDDIEGLDRYFGFIPKILFAFANGCLKPDFNLLSQVE